MKTWTLKSLSLLVSQRCQLEITSTSRHTLLHAAKHRDTLQVAGEEGALTGEEGALTGEEGALTVGKARNKNKAS